MTTEIPQVKIVNVETNEEITRDMNADELAWFVPYAKEANDKFENADQDEADKAAAKASAQAKLAALGLTSDEVAAIIGA